MTLCFCKKLALRLYILVLGNKNHSKGLLFAYFDRKAIKKMAFNLKFCEDLILGDLFFRVINIRFSRM